MSEEKVSRRKALKIVAGTVAGLAVGGVAGYLAGRATPAPAETVTSTVTKTVAAGSATTVAKTETVTKTITKTISPTTVATTTPTPTITLGPEDEKYAASARELVKILAPYSPVPPEELERELLWFVAASKPYRGTKIKYLDECDKCGEIEKFVAKIFEKLTGIKVEIEVGGSTEVSQKVLMEIETHAGYADIFSLDGGDLSGINRRGGFINLAEFWEENPDLFDPYFDLHDIVREGIWNAKTWKGVDDIRGLPHFTCPTGWLYRRDLIDNPKNKEEFKKKYGYDLKHPWEYFEDFLKTGDPEAGWTIDKVRDMVEFFHRPSEGLYGCYVHGRASEDLIWTGVMTTTFGLYGGYAHPEKGWKMDLEDWWVEPKYWGEIVDKKTGKIKDIIIDSPAGVEFLKFYKEMFNYAPEAAWDYGNVEATCDYTTKRDAFICLAPTWHLYYIPWWLTLGPEFDRQIGIAPFAVNPKTWDPNKHAWGWDDIAYLAIPEGSKNKEAAILYLQFTLSKAMSLYKMVQHDWPGPMRVSTIESLALYKWALKYPTKPWLFQYLKFYSSPIMLRSVTEDTCMIDYIPLHSGLYPPFHKYLTSKDMTAEEAAKLMDETLINIAKELDIWAGE